MVAFIFAIIFLIAGIGFGIGLAVYKDGDSNSSFTVTSSRGCYSESKEQTVDKPYAKYSWIAFVAGIVLAIVFLFISCSCSVPTGHTGVITVFGKVKDGTLDSGYHIKAPWESVVKMDNRVQKETLELSCFSSDIQEVNVVYTLNFQINKANASQIYKTIGTDYYNVTISPAIAESLKVVVAKYTAEELIGARETLAVTVEENLSEQLLKFNIEVVSTAIEDMDFTDSFTDAVEAKQVADQKSKQARIEQEQAKMEAEYKKDIAEIEANAAAEVAKIQAEADLAVQQINADAAEYTGRKEAAVTLQALAGINGWIVVSDENGTSRICKADGSEVTTEELKIGTNNLIKYYYTQVWDGKLPTTYMGEGDVSTVVIP